MRLALIVALCIFITSCNAGHSATISWTEAATGVTGYDIFRSPHGKNTYVSIASTAALSYRDAAVVVGQSYDYYVIAVKAGVDSVRSNVVTATIP